MTNQFNSTILNDSCPYALPEEIQAVKEIAHKFNSFSQMVMIGAGPGVFALAALEDHPDPPTFTIIDKVSTDYAQAHLEAARPGLQRVHYIVNDSVELGDEWMPSSLDLLIVDGDHSYKGVSQDLNVWKPAIAPGGYIFIHDYLTREDGFGGTGEWVLGPVSDAVSDHLSTDEQWKLIAEIGISVIYQRSVGYAVSGDFVDSLEQVSGVPVPVEIKKTVARKKTKRVKKGN